MKFLQTALAGAWIIEPELVGDDRGFFARTFCEQEFAAQGLEIHFPQHSMSYNKHKGTLRGLHYQAAPNTETKIVRCSAGAIFDVIVDLRMGSASFGRWIAVELTAENHRMLYVPRGFAHGFQTLVEACEVSYQISVEYNLTGARGLRYDDPALAIVWPLPVSIMSRRDRSLPTLADINMDC